MNNSLRIFAVTGLMAMAAFLSSCSSSYKKQQVDGDIAKEPPSTLDESIRGGHIRIFQNPDLTADQRQKLNDLYIETYRRSREIRGELARVKGVFFKQLFNEQEDPQKMAILKDKLIALNNERMNIMLAALDKARKIMGKSVRTEDLDWLDSGFWN